MMDSRRRTGARMFRLFGTPRSTSQNDPPEAKEVDESGARLRVRAAGALLLGGRPLSHA